MADDKSIDRSPLLNSVAGGAAGASGYDRPGLVWVIAVFYGFAAIWNCYGYYVAFSGRYKLPPAMQAQFDAFNVVDHIQAVLGIALSVLGAIHLFRMRRVAPYLFTIAIGVNCVLTAWGFVSGHRNVAMLPKTVSGALVGTSISVAVCAYAWLLHHRGRLH